MTNGADLPFDPSDYRVLHKRIVHLSTTRLSTKAEGAFCWDAQGGRHVWANRVLRGFGTFHRSLKAASADRASWFTEGFNEAKKLLAG